jgi:benzoyl-CoA reductase/2-hydroxyglutaryl-CoA dehydratase subunit BcrC/BadD/HgdB
VAEHNPTQNQDQAQEQGRPVGRKSVKRLQASANATKFQKEWFHSVQERVRNGEPFALVSTDVPHEILRAMDIPYIVNQWWSSVSAAKQVTPRYLDLLEQNGYRRDLCNYCAQSLAAAMDPEPEKGAWGGLPKPTVLIGVTGCDAQEKIFDLMSKKFGVPLFFLDLPSPRVLTHKNWWEKMPHHWDELIEPHRIDLLVENYKELIRFLEIHTGRTFSETKLKQILDRANEQMEYKRKTRDLIAETSPAPVGISDTMPATMIPQWHRGSEDGVRMAKAMYEEVKERVENGEAAVPNERVRLMWIGLGLWFNMGFYQHFEDKYGVALTWSFYLGLASDAYARYGGEPLRQLAARFLGLDDVLRLPQMNVQWYVHEAKHNRMHGAVQLISPRCGGGGGGYFFKKAFADAGIPLLQIHANNVDASGFNEQEIIKQLEQFLENEIGVKPNA